MNMPGDYQRSVLQIKTMYASQDHRLTAAVPEKKSGGDNEYFSPKINTLLT
jgi:hypothetical protein